MARDFTGIEWIGDTTRIISGVCSCQSTLWREYEIRFVNAECTCLEVNFLFYIFLSLINLKIHTMHFLIDKLNAFMTKKYLNLKSDSIHFISDVRLKPNKKYLIFVVVVHNVTVGKPV